MKIAKPIFAFTLLLLAAVACREVPVTGRRQLSIIPDAQMNAMALQSYNQFLTENKANVEPATNQQAQTVRTIGERIRDAVILHSQQNNYYSRIKDFQWEFNTVQDKAINAWCMPGGKVVVYTGILPVTQNNDALAVVMGHEIAHAVAGHGGERASQQMTVQGLLAAGSVAEAMNKKPNAVHQIVLQAAGVGSQLGLLAFSRNQESEADRIGLVYAAMAGYNPDESVPFWRRMAAQAGNGQKPPELLSTHPSDERRIADLQKMLPDVKAKYYRPRN
jgi:predicted Zn-dependent protease